MKSIPSIRSLTLAIHLGALTCVLFGVPSHAQTVGSATQALLDKARAFEVRGRMDMAAQTWQQVLLADPNNTDALAGLSRSAKLAGSPALAKTYLDRIRAINPNDRNLGHVENLGSQATQTVQPQPAGKSVPSNQPSPSQSASGIAEDAVRSHTLEERRAYSALNTKNIPEAELLFKAILARDPENPRALAGMGYVRMQQSGFSAAVSFFEHAKRNGARDPHLNTTLQSAMFSSLMSEGSTAFSENNLTIAEQRYRSALSMYPTNPEALAGLGGTLLKAQQPETAIAVYERYISAKPAAPEAWRGLFMAQLDAGKAPQALQTEERLPPAVRVELMRDFGFLRSLASAYSAVGRDDDAQRVLNDALNLPFPQGGHALQADTQLQYASLLLQANRLQQAAVLFQQILQTDPSNIAAWQGLVRVQHAMNDDLVALQTLKSMPPASYQSAMRDPGFQILVAGIYQSRNKLDIAQDILEKSVSQQMAAGQKPSMAVLLQLAGIYLSRNQPQEAFSIYRKLLSENVDRPDAWKGLLTALHTSNRDQEALSQIQQIPPAVSSQLENDVDYLETVAAIYNNLGQPRETMVFLDRLHEHYAAARTAAPAGIDIQYAQLLVTTDNDPELYHQLLLLGDRHDLSNEQRRSVQLIWANWAVRCANQWTAGGNIGRSLTILNATARSFPGNPAVLRALAAGYVRAGLPKQAVLIFKSQNLTAATASDYTSTVEAALAIGDTKDAEVWTRDGLAAYPKDAGMLIVAAKYEQARGNSKGAADYYRASLSALPARASGVELANELSQTQPVVLLHKGKEKQLRNLAELLGGLDAKEIASQNAPEPLYLPSYSNVYGQAPVQVPLQPSSIAPSYLVKPDHQPIE
jgi:cellulose synthase operon protein C